MKAKKLLATLAGATALAGSAIWAAGAANPHPVIGFTVYDMTSFISWGKQGAETIAKSCGAKLLWQTASNDVNAQVSQMQQFVNRKVDIIAVAAVNSSTLGPQIAAAKAAGVPVLATNLSISGAAASSLVGYVGPNDVGAGEQEAEAVVEALHGKGNIVVLQGPIGQSAEIDRSQGIKNVLAKNPGVKLLAIQPGNWERDQAYKLMQDWLSRYGSQVNGVVAENDDMAIGAIRALKEKSLNGKIPVSGVDGIKDGMRAVRAGDMIETNLQNAAIELGEATQAACDYAKDGKQAPANALLQMPRITKANVNRYYGQLFDHPAQFLEGLPKLVKANLASGNYAEQ
jgi:ribose transport system substrate-binding protein